MTITQHKRLAEIRMQWLLAGAQFDTAYWESTFFLELLDEQNREIARLKEELRMPRTS